MAFGGEGLALLVAALGQEAEVTGVPGWRRGGAERSRGWRVRQVPREARGRPADPGVWVAPCASVAAVFGRRDRCPEGFCSRRKGAERCCWASFALYC